jgi:hypothetical protein
MQSFKSHFVKNQNHAANNDNSAILLERLHKGHYYFLLSFVMPDKLAKMINIFLQNKEDFNTGAWKDEGQHLKGLPSVTISWRDIKSQPNSTYIVSFVNISRATQGSVMNPR